MIQNKPYRYKSLTEAERFELRLLNFLKRDEYVKAQLGSIPLIPIQMDENRLLIKIPDHPNRIRIIIDKVNGKAVNF